jgi:glutathione S-transferase
MLVRSVYHARSFDDPEETPLKLYYSPGACSLSPHIVLRESGLPFTPVLASTKTHKLADGTDYYTVNPKGYVPLLELDDGQRLSEGPAIVQYVGDRVPERKLIAPWGTMERYRQIEWLNFTSSEIHKSFSPLFNPAMPEEAKAIFRERVRARLQWVDGQLRGRDYLMGAAFSAPDAYLFTVANWCGFVGIDMAPMPDLAAFMARMAARPAVDQALQAEGLKK